MMAGARSHLLDRLFSGGSVDINKTRSACIKPAVASSITSQVHRMKWLLVLAGLAFVEAAIVRRNAADIPVEVVYDEPLPGQLAGLRNLEARPQLSEAQIAQVKIVTSDEAPSEAVSAVDQVNPYPEQNIDDLYQKIQEIILSGSNQLRASLGADKGNEELLQRVNSTFEEFLESTRNLLELRSVNSVKQDQGSNIFQTILSNFQSAASSLFGSRPQNDEPSANPFQTIITQIQNGLSSLAGNAGTPATVLSDATTQAQGPIQFVQNAVQSFQQGVSTFLQGSTGAPGSQQDETTQGGPLQAFQSAIQQIGQNIPNPFQQTTRVPGSQSDEATTQGGPLAFLQNALGNLNPFTQGTTTAKPALAADGSTTTAPGNPLQGIVSQIQGSGNNPIIQQGQNIATQISGGSNPGEQILQQLGNNTAAQQIQQQLGQLGNNSATQQIQQQLAGNNATQQIQQQLGQLGNNTATQQIQQQLGQIGNPQQIGEQIGGAVQGNPQEIAQQIGQAISGGGSTQAPPSRSEGPLQNVLNNLNPFRRPTTKAPEEAAKVEAV